MQCPRCGSAMAKLNFKGIEIDRCCGCGGIWFDRMEREMLAAVEGSEAIDAGPASADGTKAGVGTMQCPTCREVMIRMADGEVFDVWYQGCPVCHGAYFDAGGFTEYKRQYGARASVSP